MPLPGLDLNDPVHLGIICDAEPEGHPNTRAGVRLVYARHHVIPELQRRWRWLVPLLGLTSTSSVLIVGGAYGYSLEVLAQPTIVDPRPFGPDDPNGTPIVGNITRTLAIETAAGIRAKLTQPEDAEIQAAIEAVGLTVASGDGLRLFNTLRDRPGQARSPRAADVLAEDMANNASRNRVRTALLGKGGSGDWQVITENVLTVLTDAECQTLSSRAQSLNGIGRLIHLVSTTTPKRPAGDPRLPAIYNWKSAMEWKALLPNDTIVSLYTRELL